METIFQKEFAVKANGKFKCRVFDTDKNLITETSWKPNLILDSGLDKVAHVAWAQTFQWCVSGTSGSPTKRELLNTNATWSGSTVTHADPFFTFSISDVGRVLYIPSIDTSLKITAFTSSTSVTVSQSTIAPVVAQIKIFYVEQTSLFAPHSMNMQYETSEGMCGTVITGTSVKLSRTFNFYMERTPVYIRELGFLESPCGTYNNVSDNSLFSRVVLDTPLYVSAGQFLQVSYELTVTLAPSVVTVRSIDITGWPISPATNTSGSECIQKLGMAIIGGDGVSVAYDESHLCNEPFAPGTTFIGPEFGYANRWINSLTANPIKIYEPVTANPFICRNTGSYDPRFRNYRKNYDGSYGKNYVYLSVANQGSSTKTRWSGGVGGMTPESLTNVDATIADVMIPVCLPPGSPSSVLGADWTGYDPYTWFPDSVPNAGVGSWSALWNDSGSINHTGLNLRGSSVFISNASASHAATGSCVDRSTTCCEVPLVIDPYIAGSAYLIKKGTFLTNLANRTDWRSIGIGPTSLDISPINRKTAAKYNGYVYVFDQPQTKLNTHNLNIYFKYSWTRDLSSS